MGMWMMVTGIAALLSDQFSKIALGSATSTDPLITNANYSHTFGMLGWSAITASIVLFVAIPFVSRLTQEKRLLSMKDIADDKNNSDEENLVSDVR
jgi:POT family proton-dependent oligopeptide transporter